MGAQLPVIISVGDRAPGGTRVHERLRVNRFYFVYRNLKNTFWKRSIIINDFMMNVFCIEWKQLLGTAWFRGPFRASERGPERQTSGFSPSNPPLVTITKYNITSLRQYVRTYAFRGRGKNNKNTTPYDNTYLRSINYTRVINNDIVVGSRVRADKVLLKCKTVLKLTRQVDDEMISRCKTIRLPPVYPSPSYASAAPRSFVDGGVVAINFRVIRRTAAASRTHHYHYSYKRFGVRKNASRMIIIHNMRF